MHFNMPIRRLNIYYLIRKNSLVNKKSSAIFQPLMFLQNVGQCGGAECIIGQADLPENAQNGHGDVLWIGKMSQDQRL